jgi:succinate dehydrogenase assembly factor 2
LLFRKNGRAPAAAVRFYRGDAGEMQHNLSESEEALLKVAKPRYDEIYERHVRLPKLEDIPKSSMASSTAESSADLELEVRKKRLIYRAKQRGWLEVDLLLGTWANTFVPTLNAEELDQFEAFVNCETIDIYNIITLRVDIPDNMKQEDGNSVVERIQAWARDSPLGKADPEAYKRVKTDNNLI